MNPAKKATKTAKTVTKSEAPAPEKEVAQAAPAPPKVDTSTRLVELADQLERAVIVSATPCEEMLEVAKELRKLSKR